MLGGARVASGGAMIHDGLAVPAGDVSVTAGAISITTTSISASSLNVFASSTSFAGNAILGRTAVGVNTGDSLLLQTAATTVLQVRVPLLENVHALEGLACRKRLAPASSPAAPASRVRRSRRLRSTLAAAPGLLAHALVTNSKR